MKVKLSWSQSSKIGILHKSSTLRAIIILNEVRKCAMTKTKWNPFSFNVLLSYHCNNLEILKMRNCWLVTSTHDQNNFQCNENNMVRILTCEILILDPLEPDTTIALKLLYSDKLFWALPPVLSRQSFRMRFTWFSNVWRSVLPGVGSSASLWAFSITSITSFFKFKRNMEKEVNSLVCQLLLGHYYTTFPALLIYHYSQLLSNLPRNGFLSTE